MASTAWTATREELVRELANARTAREIAVARLEATQAIRREAAERRKEIKKLSAERCKARKRETELLAQADLAGATAEVQPDPNAAQHRADLLAALKEKP